MAGSIAEEITRLTESLRLCRSAVKTKGGSISDTAGYSQLPEAIRSLSGTNEYESVTDSEVSRIKIVPEGSVGRCYLKTVGGLTYDDVRLNGNLIPYPYAEIEASTDYVEVAEGEEAGSLTYTAIEPDSIGTVTFYLNTEEFYLYPGSYYFGGPNGNNYLVGKDTDGQDMSIFVSSYSTFTVEKTIAVNKILYEIYCSKGDTGTFYPLISENEEIPWRPRWSGYRHAKVTGISVTGRNHIPFPYYDGDAGRIKTAGGITFTVLEDGGIQRVGTAKDYPSFVLTKDKCIFKPGETYCLGNGVVLYYKNEKGLGKYVQGGTDLNTILWQKDYTFVRLYVQVADGKTVDDVVYPMINPGEVALSYEQYRKTVIPVPTQLTDDEFWGCGVNEHSCNLYNLEGGVYVKQFNDSMGQEDERLEIKVNSGMDPLIEVVGGGALIFENEYDLPAVSDVQFEIYSE